MPFLLFLLLLSFLFLLPPPLSSSASLFPPSPSPNYLSALHNTLLFFEAQRSGLLPPSQRVTWRSDSALRDGFAQGVDLVGGYYDAGDNVKFGLPMAFTITMLSWSVVEYEDYISSAGELCHALEAIKWGTDYLIKAHPQPNLLWGEVGDGYSDHFCWQRPEEMTTSRQAYYVDESNPGSDLAGETAAAMAAASMVFKRTDPSYSATLLTHAKQLFHFADTFRGRYDSSISVARGFYKSDSGYGDELLWAALWLFEASGEKCYYDYAIQNADALGGTGWAMTEFSWDVKYAGVQVLVSKILLQGRGCSDEMAVLTQYQSQAQFFLCACLQKNYGRNVHRTPGGLMYTRAWNNLQYAVSASFLMTVYSDYLASSNQQLQCQAGPVEATELLNAAKSQVDYILGDNPRGTSYMVGFGFNYPQRVHHRAASIVSYREDPTFVACKEGYQKWFKSRSKDPNVHVGAIVGGPDENDNYADDRENYDQSEPTTYNSSPMVGILARLHAAETAAAAASAGSYMQAKTAEADRSSEALIISQERTASWSKKGQIYYRYQVTLRNDSTSTLQMVRLMVQGVQGPVWGLSKEDAGEDTYRFPPWIKSLPSQGSLVFVYIHPVQATISVVSAEFSS